MRAASRRAAMTASRGRQQGFIILLFWSLVFWACGRMLTPPAIEQDPPSANAFSLDAALRHVRHLSAEPHPVGSTAHAAVADYLRAQIAALGYRAEVQETLASARVNAAKPFIKAARVKNIMARIKGTRSHGAVLIAAHYDSAETAPGAADDGAAVASMLEALRALKHGPPPRNDLIFLFSDAEELGLLGSRAFVEQHPWAKDCVLALNFEARGTGGMLLMFETGANNAGVVEHYARAALQPVASSLMFSIYQKLLHNDTDFSVFRQAGMAGMNFAFIEGWTAYHSALDRIDHLDPRTLALQGQNLLALARHFGEADLQAPQAGGDLGYFNALPGKLLLFPLGNNVPEGIAGAALLIFAGLVLAGIRLRRFTLPQYLSQTLACLLLAALIAGAQFGCRAAITYFYDAFRWLGEPYNSALYFAFTCCLTAAVFTFLHGLLSRRRNPLAFQAGAIGVWLALGLYLAKAFPGGVFFAVLPGGMMSIDMACRLFRPQRNHAIVTGACTAAVLLVVAPTLYLAHHALGFHADWLLMGIAALTLGLISPGLGLLYPVLGQKLPALFFIAALAFLSWADHLADFSAERPKPNSIAYVWDGIDQSAQWLSYDPEPDAWTEQFLGTTARRRKIAAFEAFTPLPPLLTQDAQPIALAAPEVRLLAQRRGAGRNLCRLHVRSRRNAPVLRLTADAIESADAIYADDRLLHRGPMPVAFIELHNLPPAGITLTFSLPPDIAIARAQVLEIRRDLGEVLEKRYKERPKNNIPLRSSTSMPVDAAILRQIYDFF